MATTEPPQAALRPFATLLTTYRTARRISQSRLADRAGFDHSWPSRLEAAQRRPSLDTVERLTRALDLTPDETDRLRVAAGFVPLHHPALPELDPLVRVIADALDEGGGLSEAARERLRAALTAVLALADTE